MTKIQVIITLKPTWTNTPLKHKSEATAFNSNSSYFPYELTSGFEIIIKLEKKTRLVCEVCGKVIHCLETKVSDPNKISI